MVVLGGRGRGVGTGVLGGGGGVVVECFGGAADDEGFVVVVVVAAALFEDRAAVAVDVCMREGFGYGTVLGGGVRAGE